MKLKDILNKVDAGEDLTDEEKAFLKEYDPDKASNDAAAAARRKADEAKEEAEAETKRIQAELDKVKAEAEEAGNSGKSEAEKTAARLEKLEEDLAAGQAQIATLETDKVGLERDKLVQGVITEAGIQWVDSVGHDIMTDALKKALSGLSDEDLEDETMVTPVIDTFKARNAGVILDDTGHGSGSPTPGSRVRTVTPAAGENPWKKGDTWNITKQHQIEADNPEDATRLKKAAGFDGYVFTPA